MEQPELDCTKLSTSCWETFCSVSGQQRRRQRQRCAGWLSFILLICTRSMWGKKAWGRGGTWSWAPIQPFVHPWWRILLSVLYSWWSLERLWYFAIMSESFRFIDLNFWIVTNKNVELPKVQILHTLSNWIKWTNWREICVTRYTSHRHPGYHLSLFSELIRSVYMCFGPV